MSNVFTTTIRFNLDHEEDRSALAWLQKMDRQEYKSYSRAVIAAINDHFSRQERLASDPYLETREKEDAFLLRIEEAVGRGLSSAGTLVRVLQEMQGASAQNAVETATNPQLSASVFTPAFEADTAEDIEAALDFVDGF